MSQNSAPKLDLDLFRKLTSLIEDGVAKGDEIRSLSSSKEEAQASLVEYAKVLGYLASLSQECSLLMVDVLNLQKALSIPALEESSSVFNLSKILGDIGSGSGGKN